MEFEISPGGAIAIKKGRQLEVPSPHEIGKRAKELKEKAGKVVQTLFAERKRTKEKAATLKSLITTVSRMAEDSQTISDEARENVSTLGQYFEDLSCEKTAFVEKVFSEVLPDRLKKRRQIAGGLTKLLQNPSLDEGRRQEGIRLMLDRFGFDEQEEELTWVLANLFQQAGQPPVQQQPQAQQPGGGVAAGPGVGGPQQQGPRRDPNLERARRDVRTDTVRIRSIAVSNIRRSIGLPLIVATLAVSGLTYTERHSPVEYSPLSLVLETSVGRQIPVIGRQPAIDRFYYGPEVKKVIEGSPEFNIENFLIAVLFDPKNRASVERPWGYTDPATSRLNMLKKKLNVPEDQIAKTGEDLPSYKGHSEYNLDWQLAQAMLVAKKTHQPVDRATIDNWVDLVWKGRLRGTVPPWESNLNR